jgi:hypothetical protein
MKHPGASVTTTVTFICLCLMACSGNDVQDDWLNYRTTEEISRGQWDPVPTRQVYGVRAGREQQAVDLLADRSMQHLTAGEAEEWIGRPPALEEDHVFYLFRAVRTEDTGGYEVLTRGRTAVVVYRALGKTNSTSHEAIIVGLREPPDVVHVELSIAE